MEIIGSSEIWSFVDASSKATLVSNKSIREDRGYRVNSYLDLATKIAELQFRNRDHVLLFRGQSGDYRDEDGVTTLKPTLFRSNRGRTAPPNRQELTNRFRKLNEAEQHLITHWGKTVGKDRLRKYRLLRWSILQHYEVSPTPLLDVTHSLRIAASFASHNANDEVFLFVLGVPNLSGAVTASAEAGLQIVRLSSVCPPTAIRPHIQEGYLLGEYPDMPDFDQKRYYGPQEIDFGRRLIAKFRFIPQEIWSHAAFPRVEPTALYPTPQEDPLADLAEKIKNLLG